MTIPWNGKGKRPHTMWIFEYRKVSFLYILIEFSSPRKVSTDDLDCSNASYMK